MNRPEHSKNDTGKPSESPAEMRPRKEPHEALEQGQELSNRAHSKKVTKALATAQKMVLKDFKGIVEGLIKSAKDGRYQPAKLLIDIANITPPSQSSSSDESEDNEESLAELLFSELEQAKEE